MLTSTQAYTGKDCFPLASVMQVVPCNRLA